MSSGRITTSTGLLFPNPFIHAGKLRAEDLNKLIVDHRTIHDIALADKVRDEGVLRLVVDLLRVPICWI